MIKKTIAKRPGWIKLNPSIQKHTIFSMDDEHIDDADVIFLTAVETAKPVKICLAPKRKKVLFNSRFRKLDRWGSGCL